MHLVELIAESESVTFKPPKAAADEAKKAIQWKEEHGDAVRAGTRVGWARAHQLANREDLSLETVRRMVNFFNRHEKNKAINPKFSDEPWRDNGYVAWLLWGGDAGRKWASSIVKATESING